MALVNRGRLSVQRVDEATFDVLSTMAERGGWEDMDTTKKAKKSTASAGEHKNDEEGAEEHAVPVRAGRKRKAATDEEQETPTAQRRSTRLKG
jgi:hypothetical protein